MLAAANAQFAGNMAKRDEMVALNPYKPGLNICKYCVIARLTVEDGIHSDSCPVVAGKVTSKMLLKETSFVATVANFGGKVSEKVMRAEAAKLGFYPYRSTLCPVGAVNSLCILLHYCILLHTTLYIWCSSSSTIHGYVSVVR